MMDTQKLAQTVRVHCKSFPTGMAGESDHSFLRNRSAWIGGSTDIGLLLCSALQVGNAQLQRAMAAAASRGLSDVAAREMAEAAAKRGKNTRNSLLQPCMIDDLTNCLQF
jgi:hypothetical protein